MDISDRTFYSATSTKKDWRDVVSELSRKLEKGSGNLGIIYLSEDLLVSLENIIKELKIETSCHNWLGAGGYGVLSNFGEFRGSNQRKRNRLARTGAHAPCNNTCRSKPADNYGGN